MPVQHLARAADLLDRDHSETTVPASSASARAQHVLGRGEILDREAERLEDGQLVARAPSLGGADQQLADLGADVLGPDRALALREQEVARLVDASTRAGRRTAPRRAIVAVSSSRVVGMLEPTAFTCAPSFSHSRCTIGSARRRRGDDDVRVAHRLLGRRDLLDAVELRGARPGVRLQTTTRSKSRTARIASRCALPWMPAPRIASVRASSRASSRVATPETAAVRTAVIAARVQERARLAGLAVEERDEALVEVEPARRVARGITTVFSPQSGVAPPR